MGQCLAVERPPSEQETEDALSAKQYAKKSLHSIAIFSKLEEQDLGGLEELTFSAGDDIVVEGDSNIDLIYILRAGCCSVKQDGAVINNLGRGSVIGERAFIAQKSRSATVTAVEHCAVLAIKRSSLEKALGFDGFVPAIASEELVFAEKLSRLSQFPLIASMPDDYLKNMAQEMSIKQYLPDEAIILKGAIGEEFYFIDRGCVDIVDGGPENVASPASIKLSFPEKSPSIKSASSRCSTPSSKLKFDGPVECNPSFSSKVPLIDFDAQANNAEASPTSSVASSPERKRGDDTRGGDKNPLLDEDTAEIINVGVNDFLQHYESQRMQNLGGLIQDLKSGKGKRSSAKPKSHKMVAEVPPKTTEWGDVKATLRAGQFFGEMALMEESSGRRTASCLARTHCTLLVMKKEPFLRLMDILNGNG